jgi:hypothetical protein
MPFPRKRREPEPETSEAMNALKDDRERAFVTFYLLEAPHHGAQTHAYRKAGYGNPNSPPITFQRNASKLIRKPTIQRAILEEAKKMLRGAAPEAVNGLLEIIRTPNHRDRTRAIEMLLNRTDTVETHSTITHQIQVDHHREALDQLALMKRLGVAREKLEEMFGYSGLGFYEAKLAERDGAPKRVAGPEPKPAPPVIEGEAKEIKPSGDRW